MKPEQALRLVKSYFLIHTFGNVRQIVDFGIREGIIKGTVIEMQEINYIVKGLTKKKVLDESLLSYYNYTLLSDINPEEIEK